MLTLAERGLLLAQDAPAAPEVNPVIQFLPFVVLALLLYIIILRPQQREVARRRNMLGNLKKNDKVITQSGIIGTVANISTEEDEVTLKVDDNTRIKFLKSAITEVVRPPDADAKKT